MILGLMGNRDKQRVARMLPDYTEWLRERGVSYLISEDFAELPGLAGEPGWTATEIASRADVILSFGGDGTLLNSVKRLEGAETPVLGVNLGGLGYLTEAASEEITDSTERLLAGRYEIDPRMVLEVTSPGSETGPWYGLNDVVIDKAGFARLIRLEAEIDSVHLNTFRADGLIVATPTGSTGYNLSAGGPILEPSMSGILITPLNPHSLSNRPLAVGADKCVRIHARSPLGHVNVAVDGETILALPDGQPLNICRAAFSANLIKFEGRVFYDVLRRKLGWGESGDADRNGRLDANAEEDE